MELKRYQRFWSPALVGELVMLDFSCASSPRANLMPLTPILFYNYPCLVGVGSLLTAEAAPRPSASQRTFDGKCRKELHVQIHFGLQRFLDAPAIRCFRRTPSRILLYQKS